MPYPKKLLESLYQTMVRIRLCEESLVEPILAGKVRCPCHLYSGQEAVAAGICASLQKNDYVFGNHRSHGHYLAKGGSMAAMVAEIFGRRTGCSRGRGGSMHLIAPEVGMMGAAPIVAGTISLALGAALASSLRQDRTVAVSFFGDGATGEGVLYECLNFAALKKLPLLFVCENNFYATHLPLRECRAENRLCRIGEPFGVPSCAVDGNDVLKVYEVAKTAISRCRAGLGPALIECLTYRFRGHVGPDDNLQGTHTDIRPQAEIQSWRQRDPIILFEEYLEGNGLMHAHELAEIKAAAELEVAEAHAFAMHSDLPDPKELTSYVFKQ
jgi:TPP-dependent pyruvate/acetoin dehydrogenase alpha subunit